MADRRRKKAKTIEGLVPTDPGTLGRLALDFLQDFSRDVLIYIDKGNPFTINKLPSITPLCNINSLSTQKGTDLSNHARYIIIF